MVENAPFTCSADGGGEEIREVPFAYTPNIIRKAADMVIQHEK